MGYVCLDNNVDATAGTIMYPPAVSGTWSAGSLTYTNGSHITVDGIAVCREAECTFTFTGTDSSGNPVSGSSTVTLTAGTTVLRDDGHSLLLKNDTTSDSYGNTLTANPSQTKLKSS